MATNDDDPPLNPKPVRFVGSSRRDIRQLPNEVKLVFGQALFAAQIGSKHSDAKPLRGFGGAGVLEIVEDDRGSAYRAVYTVKFPEIVYVLHVFQKKSKSGIKTPTEELVKLKVRLKAAERDYAKYIEQQKNV